VSSWIQRFSLKNRTALVTGASKGIGAEICSVFSDAGANIVATARDEKSLFEVKNKLEEAGGKCSVKVCDLEDKDAINALMDTLEDENIEIDILVNNAGVALVDSALDLSVQQWERTMSINLTAPFLLSQRVAPGMIERQSGKIINVSSQAAVVAFDEHVAYAASKAAMNAMTRGLMKEWAQHNIQVNAICPTVILTDMGKEVWSEAEKKDPLLNRTPLGRFGMPVEVADMALYLASSASSLVNGETLMIDGGYSTA